MEKEEQKKLFEQEEVEDLEEQEEVEETSTMFIRKSRTENGNKTTEIDFQVTVSGTTSNGHTELVENGAENEEETPAEEQEIEKINGVLEKEPEEAIDEQTTPAAELEIEESNGVLEKEPEEVINGEQEIEKSNGVLEKEPEAINGEQTEQEIEKPNGVLNGEQKSQNLVFHDNVDGIDSTITYLKEKQFLKEPETKVSSLHFVVQSNSNGHKGEIENNIISNSIFKPAQVSESSAEIESEAVDPIDEEDYDVERVIEKQTTHDLFCPNCNSCITKRVILRKRKRNIRISGEEFKRNKQETAQVTQSDGDGVDNDAEITVADEDEPDRRRPALFRCLSCFTFFIPSGDGFKCLPLKDWFSSMFTPNKLGPVVDQGSISQTVVQRGEASSSLSDQPSFSATIENNYTWAGRDEISPLLNQKPPVNGNVANAGKDKLDVNQTVTIGFDLFDSYSQDVKGPKSSQVVHNNHGSDLSVATFPARTQVNKWKPVKDAIVFSQGREKLPISANNGSLTLEESDEKDNEVIHHSPSPTSISTSDADGKLNISISIPHDEHDLTASITTDTVHEHNYANFISSDNVTGQVHHSKGSEHRYTTTNITFSNESPNVDNNSEVKDGAIARDTEITIPPSETPSVAAGLVNQISISDNARKEYEIEVVKSIVYGGLAESITSLSIVSSAAGGGAATLNVLALGAANLIGGLFIICHNLWDLRYHQFEQVSNQINEQQDRYRELLGRRQSFIMHAIVALISYITFGLVPPLVYGFSFRETDDRQLKLLVVGATSLVCILILAIAKAYTRRRPKPYLKTVATYVVLGFMVSGVAYVAGELVERLLNELGLFRTSEVPNVEMKRAGSGWASY